MPTATAAPRYRRWLRSRRAPLPPSWGRLPLRIRLVAGFSVTILLVLSAAGAFVYLRVQYALDLRLNEDLSEQAQQVAGNISPLHETAVGTAAVHSSFQVLDTGNRVLAHGPGVPGTSLLRPQELASALVRPQRRDRGALLPISARPLRLYAEPLAAGTRPPAGRPAVVVVAARRDQRDEALRELIGQLALADLATLVIASLVGYRLARAALLPVERYRVEAARIADGATGVRLAVADTTHDEVARLGRTLNDMLAALEAAVERERRFVNDASHELLTPLTLLSTELELALRRPRTAQEMQQALLAAASDTAGLIALADTLLSVGVQTVADHDAAVIDLGRLVDGLVDRYRASACHRDAAILTDTAPGLTVRGDPVRLGQVLTNLLDNALRHGAGSVTVITYGEHAWALLTVHDNGPGMDPRFLPQATERFSRADAARTSPGSGLGLSLVDTIVRAHHGELRIYSGTAHHHGAGHRAPVCRHPDSGSTVTALLPIATT
ncbi:HAMP domain-containing sensor histidine kinase [Streptomyces sp. SPB162]|uniref:sensor histidine kinase n=1 Tax=Streptomyces sp. SPB162 TaxID=2940560 RepID=UPI0024060D04|nr:HAMP domain-containing sensor histidine kinase [Streptomyces sp. SPB162]MDF9814231.1 two-component system OmpR family sensor kinase [Streptomyces sp. SPB162]